MSDIGDELEYQEEDVFEEEEEIDDLEPDKTHVYINNVNKEGKRVPNSQRISRPFLTKYEIARILGLRTNQIEEGATIYVKVAPHQKSWDIAMEELRQKVIPFILKRFLPNGDYEEWKLSELSF